MHAFYLTMTSPFCFSPGLPYSACQSHPSNCTQLLMSDNLACTSTAAMLQSLSACWTPQPLLCCFVHQFSPWLLFLLCQFLLDFQVLFFVFVFWQVILPFKFQEPFFLAITCILCPKSITITVYLKILGVCFRKWVKWKLWLLGGDSGFSVSQSQFSSTQSSTIAIAIILH